MFVMLFLRGYLKINPEAYCTFSVVSEGNVCQEAHFIELKHLFFFYIHVLIFILFLQLTQGIPIPIHQRPDFLIKLTKRRCPLQIIVILYGNILHGSHVMDLIPEQDVIPYRDNEIELFRQYVGRGSDPQPTAHSSAFPQYTEQARCKQKM